MTSVGWEARRPLSAELAILGTAVAYGMSFAIIQDALDDTTPVGFVFLRFSVAALALAPIALLRVKERRAFVGISGVEARSLFARATLAFGVVGFAGYTLQNAGLEHTTTSNSAFITGLYVVFVPLIETVATRRRPQGNVLLAVGGAVLGLFLLTGASVSMNRGDVLTVGCAFFFGWWIYLGGRYASSFDPFVLSVGQMVVFVVLSVPIVAVEGFGTISGDVIVATLLTGIVASALAFSAQLWGQRRVEPARAGVLLMLEPVVGGIVGYAIGERLGVSGYVGAVVILAAIFVAESGVWIRARQRAVDGRSAASPG